MTVSSETAKSGPYTGNGVTTVFAYNFRILDAAHIEVVRTVNGTASTVSPSEYTVSGVGSNAGGNVTFTIAPAAGQTITVVRNAPFTQQVDLENQGAYYAETIEEALDLAAMRDQQMAEELTRAVKLPVGSDPSGLPALTEDLIRLSDSADEIDAVAGIETEVVTVAGLTAEIAALPGQLTAAQAAAAAAEAALDSLDDRYLGAKAVAPTVDNDGNALLVGAVYWDTVSSQMFTWSGAEWRPTFLTGSAVRALVTATGGQTAVTVPTYLVGANTISVFLNGLKVMVGADYTETDQNTITFASALTGGDEVEVLVLQPYAIGTTGAESITTVYGVTMARLLELREGTVAQLLADTTLNPAVVPVGSVIEAGGFRYQVAASGASDHHVTTAGGVKLYLTSLFQIDVRAFGATGIGDDAVPLQAAIDLWVSRLQDGHPCFLRIPGKYTFSTGLLASFTSVVFAGGGIDMRGGKLISALSSSGVAFELRSRTEVRNLTFYDFQVRGSANDTVTCLWDGGSSAATPKQFLYNCQWYSPKVENAPAVAWRMTDNFFECAIFAPWLICTSTTAGTYACWLEDTATSNPSSIDIYGGSMRGGQYALYSDDVGDVKVFGGTYLQSGNYCISMQNNISGGLDGVHVENAWVGGSGSNLAGVRMTNSGYVRGLYGVSDGTGAQDTALNVFGGGQGITVDGVFVAGNTTSAIYVAHGSTAVNIRGVPRSRIVFAALAEQRSTGIERQGVTVRNAAATGTITLNMDAQDYYDAVLSGNVTFAAPTSGVAGDVLTITAQQAASGGPFTVAWNAVFVVTTPMATTASAKTTWTFRFSGGAWVEQVANATTQTPIYAETNVTPDRAFNADTVTVAELADVVGTLIADLRVRGIVR